MQIERAGEFFSPSYFTEEFFFTNFFVARNHPGLSRQCEGRELCREDNFYGTHAFSLVICLQREGRGGEREKNLVRNVMMRARAEPHQSVANSLVGRFFSGG